MSGERIAAVLGVAQVPMRTRLSDATYADLLGRVAHGALADAGVDAKDVDGLILAMAPTSTLGIDEPQYWALAGLPGASHFLGRVHTLASSGLVAFRLACAHVAAGRAKRVLVVAADLADEAPDLIGAIQTFANPFAERHYPGSAATAHAFQMAAYMARNGIDERVMAGVIVKNRANGALNEYAQLRQAITVDEVLSSPVLSWPIKRADASPRTSGAAAVLVGPPSDGQVAATGFGSYANHGVSGARMVPGVDESYLDASDLAAAAKRAYAQAGVGDPVAGIDLAEVYASFGIIELLSIEGLGLAGQDCAAQMIANGEFHRDSRLPVNASGGATCGSPISATGLIRVIEATLQLRGTAGARQVTRTPRRAAVSAIGGLFQLHDVAVLAA
ncbi:MAG TPA: thiolase family protein [Hyphomicrobiales bacterium]|nr:thiolase family protein [Hyphomicrobiales bacterium]